MNLRKKNKKLKRQLEWAESQLEYYKALCETKPKTTTEHVPTRTLKACCLLTDYELDRPGFAEYVKEELVYKMSRELATAICVEHRHDHAGVIPRTIVEGSITIVEPKHQHRGYRAQTFVYDECAFETRVENGFRKEVLYDIRRDRDT